MICLFLSVSLSHDLIIIGIINNITSRSLSLCVPIEGPNLHFILLRAQLKNMFKVPNSKCERHDELNDGQ